MLAFQITTSTFAETNPSVLDPIIAAGYEVRPNPYGRRLTRDEIIKVLRKDVVALLAGLEPLDRSVLAGSNLRVVSRVGSGTSNVDREAAKELGITVCSTPDGPTEAVAELTIAGALAVLRDLPAMDAALSAGLWDKRTGGEIQGRTAVVLGLGRIGRRVAELFKAFGATVIGVDPFVQSSQVGIDVQTLKDALPRADILSVHASGHSTLIAERQLALLPRGAIVLNAARGGVVNETDLLGALDSGKVSGAWLDVFEEEPYNGPLAKHPRTVVTPHAGSYTRESRLRMESSAITNALEVLGAAS